MININAGVRQSLGSAATQMMEDAQSVVRNLQLDSTIITDCPQDKRHPFVEHKNPRDENNNYAVTISSLCQNFNERESIKQGSIILGQSVADDVSLQHREDSASLAERLQKSLIIRKQTLKGVQGGGGLLATADVKPSSFIMSNYTEVVGGKPQNYQRELNNKIINSIQKLKEKGGKEAVDPATQRVPKAKREKVITTELPKPKSFAENLMNMLAKQNIGHAFSENPVEALSILKDNKGNKTAGAGKWDNGSKGLKRSIQGGARNDGNSAQNNHPQQIDSQASTIDGATTIGSKFTQFPKLSDFKSATNNIYLQNRPVVDPRQEAEFQQVIKDHRIKLIAGSNVSRTDIHKPPDMSTRKSYEHQANGGNCPPLDRYIPPISSNNNNNNSPRMPTGVRAIEDNMMLQRPTKDPNLIVIQAYKKQMIANPAEFSKAAMSAKPKRKQSEHVQSKSKNKFAKMTDIVEEGIMFPLTLSNNPILTQGAKVNKRGQPSGSSSVYNSQNNNIEFIGGGNQLSLSNGQGSQSNMPPIYTDTQIKLMII